MLVVGRETLGLRLTGHIQGPVLLQRLVFAGVVGAALVLQLDEKVVVGVIDKLVEILHERTGGERGHEVKAADQALAGVFQQVSPLSAALPGLLDFGVRSLSSHHDVLHQVHFVL